MLEFWLKQTLFDNVKLEISASIVYSLHKARSLPSAVVIAKIIFIQ